jgi:predicted Zn-dependent protease
MILRVPGVRLALLCTSALLFACGTLSVEEEKKLGTQAQRAVRQEFQMVRDRVVVNYLRDMGADLVAAAKPSPFDFRFYVVEDDAINAFALPGGAIYVHTGTIQKAADASELAGVVAHEIAHVTARHVAHLYRRQRNTGVAAQVVTILVAILTGNPYIANAASLGSQVAATAYLTTFTRDAESESDTLAVETLIAAGYDPNGMLTFFDTLRKETACGTGMPQFLSSHPATAERIVDVRQMIQKHAPLAPDLRRGDGGKLEIIQKRIELVAGTDPGES